VRETDNVFERCCIIIPHGVSRWGRKIKKKINNYRKRKIIFAMSQVQVDSPSVMESIVGTGGVGSRIASPNSTMASALPALLHLQVQPPSVTNATTTTTTTPAAKRSNFSISNLLATEEEKKTTTESNENKQPRLNERDDDLHFKSLINDSRIVIQPPGVGSPFLNASALAHLAHLHHGSNPPATSSSSSSSTSNSAIPGWPDWLGSAGLGPDAHQSLWSR
jgi:hypothetical protein